MTIKTRTFEFRISSWFITSIAGFLQVLHGQGWVN